MTIWGRLSGGGLGNALGNALGGSLGGPLGGPLGAVLSAFLGAAAGCTRDRLCRTAADADPVRQSAFTAACVVLGAKMAKADGFVCRDEVAAFRQVFHVPAAEMRTVARLFDIARRDALGFESYARQVATLLADRPAVLEKLLGALFHIATADGRVLEPELAYLHAVARIFGFSDAAFARIRAVHVGDVPVDDPYALLGVPPEAGDGDVRAAWLAAVRENHPDRLIAQGLPQECIDLATEKTARLNEAYERIRRARGTA